MCSYKVFRDPTIGVVTVANVHIVAGTFKSKLGHREEDHAIPGKSPDKRENFKLGAVTGVIMAVDELMGDGRGNWFVVGDLNLVSDQVDRLLKHAGVK